MITPHDLIFAVLLPGVISLVLLLIAWRPWSRGEPRGYWAGGLAIGVGFAVGLLGLQKMPSLPPASAEDWLFYIGPAAAVIALVDAFVRMPRIFRILLALIGSAGSVYLVLKVQHQWAARENVVWIGAVTLAMTAGFLVLDLTNARLRGGLVPALLALTAAGLGLFMMFSGSQTYGQRAGIVFATTLAAVPLAIWSGRVTLARGGVLAWVMLMGGLIVTCYEYPDNVVPYRLVLIAAAPIIGLLPAVSSLRGWKRWAACLLLTAIPIGLAVVPAGVQFVHDYNAPHDDSGY